MGQLAEERPARMITDYSQVRSLERWGNAVFQHESLAAFQVASLGNGVHVIDGEGPPIDVHLALSPGRPMVVFFNGNAPRDRVLHMPVFSGRNILPRAVEASRVCISDPTLHLAPDLCIGWYAGSKEQNLQALIPQILSRVIEIAKPSKVILAGGSAGGFASLYYATYFPESLAFVWNPQTDIRRYNPSHVLQYASTAFTPAAGIEAAQDILTASIEPAVAPRYREARNHVLYLQNASDGHTQRHLGHLLKQLRLPVPEGPGQTRPQPNMHLVVGEWGEGHLPPAKDALTSIFTWLVEAPGSWSGLFAGDAVETKMREAL